MTSITVSTASIAEQSTTVEKRFSAVIAQLPGKHQNTVQDSHDRFRLWATSVGALSPPFSRHSLVYRLSSAAPELLGDVCDLLTDLSEALNDLLDTISSNPENLTLTPPDSKDLILDGLGDQTDSAEDQATTLLEIADECISGLFRLAALVRKPTSGQDRFSKAQNHAAPFPDHFDITYVQERYPKLNRPETRWLSERFGRANTKRRQFLRHAREHRDRLYSQTPEVPQTPAPDTTGATAPDSLQSLFKVSIGKSMQTTTKAMPPSTKASTFVPVDRVKGKKAGDDSQSSSPVPATTYASYHRDDIGSLLIPSLMDVNNNGESEFECPLCWVICSISNQRAWKRHVFADLKPYVCCLGEGECDDLLFHDRLSWFNHELQCHRRQWACIMCEGGPFEAAEIFEDHLKSTHSDIPLDMDALEAVKDASQRAVSEISAADCPFCDDWEDMLRQNVSGERSNNSLVQLDNPIFVSPHTFRRHVAHHMEQLALFALPRGLGIDRDEDESNSTTMAGRQIEDLFWDPSPAFGDSNEEHASIISGPEDIDQAEDRGSVEGKSTAPFLNEMKRAE
ncbi:hypothetical protein F5Y12DRAFT_721373 [Xylaria sp. FL1777]|nr:hypothetical protein F5Y12DRAFT_721373 [Xylaria sp. FL1777]